MNSHLLEMIKQQSHNQYWQSDKVTIPAVPVYSTNPATIRSINSLVVKFQQDFVLTIL
jgi:hypothetical protein